MSAAPDQPTSLAGVDEANLLRVSPWNNIVLTGFMGTGKSTVGRLLALRLRVTHVDTDHMIERRHGPIPRLFAELGEEGFREIERNVAAECAHDVGYVISTGGRFMIDPHNADLLTPQNRVFCLAAEIDEVMRRVMKRRSTRPLLAGGNPRAKVVALLEERREAYGQFEQVPTGDAPPMTVVDEIFRRLRAHPAAGQAEAAPDQVDPRPET